MATRQRNLPEASRKPSTNVQVNFRLREGVRKRLIQEAEKNQVPLTREIANRLEASLKMEAIKSIEAVTADMTNTWNRIRKSVNA